MQGKVHQPKKSGDLKMKTVEMSKTEEKSTISSEEQTAAPVQAAGVNRRMKAKQRTDESCPIIERPAV